jgi:hypothetical protein
MALLYYCTVLEYCTVLTWNSNVCTTGGTVLLECAGTSPPSPSPSSLLQYSRVLLSLPADG